MANLAEGSQIMYIVTPATTWWAMTKNIYSNIRRENTSYVNKAKREAQTY